MQLEPIMHGQADRITLFVPSLRGGGAERIMSILATELARREKQVDLVTASGLGPNRRLVCQDVRIIDLGATHTSLSTLRLVRYLREERPRVLLSAVDNANLVAQAAIRLSGGRTRHICSVHIAMKTAARLAPRWRDRLLLRASAKAYKNCDAVVAVSEGAAAEYRALSNRTHTPVAVIYNPVITSELFTRVQEQASVATARLQGAPFVVGMGRLTPQKDFDMFIRAVALVREARPDVRALIIGEGEERFRLNSAISELGQQGYIELCGYIENPYAIVDQAAVFALSSKWEALPTVLIEALALGPRLVATDCPSGPREILEGGKYGELTPVGDAAQFASAILTAIESGRERRPDESWRRFRADVAADKYLRLMESL